MSASSFDKTIHSPNRLKICAFLSKAGEVEFSTLVEFLSVSDSVLSKQIKILEDSDYIETNKKVSEGRPRTWVNLTKSGFDSYLAHINELKAIIEGV